jgi:hypothetical protein
MSTQEYEPGKSPGIRNLTPGLREIGKIKIGMKGGQRQKQDGSGTYNLPTKVDHFIVTTLERDKDGVNFRRDEALYAKLKLDPQPKRLPIRLLFDDINLNLQSRYACYTGKTLFCSGDGVAAFQLEQGAPGRKQVKCPCHRQDRGYKGPDACKIHATLSVLIDGANTIGGVWKLRTTSYNTTVGMYGSLMLISTMTGGILAGLPLQLTVAPKITTDPDGKSQTIFVVGIEYDGDIASLQDGTLKIAQRNAEYRQRLIAVEDNVRKMISVDAELVDEAGDIVDEYHQTEPQPPQLSTPEATPPAQPMAVTQAPTPTPPPVAPTQAAPAPAEPAKRGRPKAQKPVETATEQVPQVPPAVQPAPAPAPLPPPPPVAAPAPTTVGVDLFS